MSESNTPIGTDFNCEPEDLRTHAEVETIKERIFNNVGFRLARKGGMSETEAIERQTLGQHERDPDCDDFFP